MSLSKLAMDVALFIANNPELATDAVNLARALVHGKPGDAELTKLKRRAEAERSRRAALAADAKRKAKR